MNILMTPDAWLVFIGLVFAVAGSNLVWVIWYFVLTPRVSRILGAANRRHLTIIDIWHDNGQRELVQGKIHSAGFVQTMEKRPRYFPLAGVVYRKLQSDMPTQEDLEALTPEEKAILGDTIKVAYEKEDESYELAEVEKEAMKVYMFKGSRTPVFSAYAGLALATNPNVALGLTIETGNDSAVQTTVPSKIRFLKNGVTKILNVNPVKVLFPFNPAILRKYMPKMYPQERWQYIVEISEEVGYRSAKSQKNDKMMFWGGLAFAIIGAVLCGIALFAK